MEDNTKRTIERLEAAKDSIIYMKNGDKLDDKQKAYYFGRLIALGECLRMLKGEL